jgi:hypothetical protein
VEERSSLADRDGGELAVWSQLVCCQMLAAGSTCGTEPGEIWDAWMGAWRVAERVVGWSWAEIREVASDKGGKVVKRVSQVFREEWARTSSRPEDAAHLDRAGQGGG